MNTEKKLTAVEWLDIQLDSLLELYPSENKKLNELIQQAKEKEKQQIIDAGNGCAIKQHLHHDKIEKMSEQELRDFAEKYEHVTFGEQYYNETFKKQ